MKLRIMSDLHLEFSNWTPEKVDCDAVIVAGDAWLGTKAIPWLAKHFKGLPVIYIAGNHESYGGDIASDQANLREEALKSGIRYLERDTVVLKDGDRKVVFIGTTMWTDFDLAGTRERSMRIAGSAMNDYYKIKYHGARLIPEDTLDMHKTAVEYITEQLSYHTKFANTATVVVTHHLPSQKSIDNDYRDSEVNPAYASNLEYIMESRFAPNLWIHGHTHRSKDYQVGATRVVCNPRGYVPYEPNFAFNPNLVVEV